MTKDKYSIENTTSEQRSKMVSSAKALGSLSGTPLTAEDAALLDTYIYGQNEIDEILEILLKKYDKSVKPKDK